MKTYIVALALLASTQIMAESNPFDLQDNLQKIDKDQDALLSELKKLSQKKKKINVLKKHVDEAVNTTIDANVSLEKEATVEVNNTKTEDEEKKLSELKEQQLQAEEERAKLLEEQQKAQEQLALEKAQEKALLEKRKQEKLEQEKREVEAYEAQRRKKQEAEVKKEAIVDIDIAHEKRIEKKDADEEYLKAIAEVN